MNPPKHMHQSEPVRRRYLLQLVCVPDPQRETCTYAARIRPWTARTGAQHKARERSFADDCALIAAVNPLLPPGSDVRDIFDHIESPNGFFYVLQLTSQQAQQLGWRE
ncbi:MAG TPA: hypothetical protein VGL22_13420 [Terracidiphilus sp.]|jgi:hypothetical protein